MEKWIKSTDRLPKKDWDEMSKPVLAYTKGEYEVTKYDYTIEHWMGMPFTKPTHWMPLPEPPKE